MSRRTQVVTASALLVVGVALVSTRFIPGATTPLNAIGVGGSSIDFAKYFLWGGAVLLVISAFLYIRASSE